MRKVKIWHKYANPNQFKNISKKILPVTSLGCILALTLGLYLSLFHSPADYQQGDAARIMYVHVPSAWMALFIYVNMAILSVSYLVWRHPLANVMAQESASMGCIFTLICLVTGSLWGKPMWGTWWVWDARLTSVLLLFFLYLGYIALIRHTTNPEKASKLAALLVIIGVINIPIIKWSVEWWSTLHQPASVSRLDKPAMPLSFLFPLLVMFFSFFLLYISVGIMRVRSRLAFEKYKVLKIQALWKNS